MKDEQGRPIYLLRFKGGPLEGEARGYAETWPPPDRFEMPGGSYRKRQQSTLPAEVDDHPHIARGAEYEWEAS
jgi:hypothetical protein